MPPAVKSRREEYSDATRAALLDSATAAFATKGYAATSLDEVAATARVTKGALYWHFDNKKALFRAVLDDLERRTVERVAAEAAVHADPWEAALAGLRAMLDACCDSVYARVVMHEGPVALGADLYRCLDEHSLGLTRALVEATMDAGLVDELPRVITARVLHGTLGTAALLIAEAEEPDRQRVRDELETVLVRLATGLRRDRGLA